MLIHHEIKSVSATVGWDGSGNWTGNSNHKLNGLLKQVYAKSATAGTTFKFRIKDYSGRKVYDSKDASVGTLNQNNIEITLKDAIYELNIYDSSLEEIFDIMLGIQEG